MVSGIMNWMIAKVCCILPVQAEDGKLMMVLKGEKYSENHSCRDFLGTNLRDSLELKSRLSLYSCDLDHAPERDDDPGLYP